MVTDRITTVGARGVHSAARGIHSAFGPMVCEAKLKAGKLVEYGKSGSDKQLGLIERADGKTNWMIVNRYGK